VGAGAERFRRELDFVRLVDAELSREPVSVRTRLRRLYLASLFVLVLFLFSATGVLPRPLLAVAFVAWIGLGFWSSQMKCPGCGRPVNERRVKIAGRQFIMWGPWIHRKCSWCERLF